MNFSSLYLRGVNRKLKEVDAQRLQKAQHDFIIAHVPRVHQWIMKKFPRTKPWFNYSFLTMENNPWQFSIKRGNKVIAKNYRDSEVNYTGVTGGKPV